MLSPFPLMADTWVQDAPAVYAASRALINLTVTPGNFVEVLHCLVEGLKVNSDAARTRTAQVGTHWKVVQKVCRR